MRLVQLLPAQCGRKAGPAHSSMRVASTERFFLAYQTDRFCQQQALSPIATTWTIPSAFNRSRLAFIGPYRRWGERLGRWAGVADLRPGYGCKLPASHEG